MKIKKDWLPRDGDVILTKDNLIMYTFGYDHPKNKVISYLKYIPEALIKYFKISFLEHKWKFRDIIMRRPQELYTPKNFQSIINTFKNDYPQYLYYSPFLQKEVFTVPYEYIEEIFIPKERLQRLLRKEKLDSHESLAIELIEYLSRESMVPINELGIHGSTSYEMHSPTSDIDIAVYSRQNFLKVKEAVQKLVEKGIVKRAIKIPTDAYRLNRGIYKETDFVFNAIRNVEETRNEYGLYKYNHIKTIEFKCEISRDIESVFRPAIYGIEDIEILNDSIDLELHQIKQVVSMIGEFRGICEKGEKIQGVGMLEKVINQENSEIFYRVVIGSGKGKEFIKPL